VTKGLEEKIEEQNNGERRRIAKVDKLNQKNEQVFHQIN